MTGHDHPMLYTADLGGCVLLSAVPADGVQAVFVSALQRAGATIVGTLSHGFPGAGLTCVLILAESHAVLHTWPETGTVNVDVFSCTSRLRSLAAIDDIAQALGAASISIQEIPRANGSRAAILTQ